RRGSPAELNAWVVPGALFVAICSGIVLLIGFALIFLRSRFRAAWVAAGGVIVLAAILFEPNGTLLVLQAAALGAALALLGLLIERSIERSSARSLAVRPAGTAAIRPAGDSSLERSAGVGSDDSTAIRVRVPSTLDHTPASMVVPEAGQDARS